MEMKLLVEALEWMQELKYVWSNSRDSGDYDLLELIADINKIEKHLLAKPEQATLKLRESSATETFNNAVSEALAAKPVAWKGKAYGNLHHVDCGNSIPLYTSPPKREPLSDDEICNLYYNVNGAIHKFARVIEKAHGIGAEQ